MRANGSVVGILNPSVSGLNVGPESGVWTYADVVTSNLSGGTWPTSTFIELWGAGGAAGTPGAWTYGAPGGAGGYTCGYLTNIAPGTNLVLIIGGGGVQNSFSTTGISAYGGGGAASASVSAVSAGNVINQYGGGVYNQYGGGGGGLTGLFNTTYAWASAIMVAGGGGGGGSSRTGPGNYGGAGGGFVGQQGGSAYDGLSGTYGGLPGSVYGPGQTSPSQSFTYYNNTFTNTFNTTYGVMNQDKLTGGTAPANSYGGAGGGGYYGGAGGGYLEPTTMGGGGGGAGYINNYYVQGGCSLVGKGSVPAVPALSGLAVGGAIGYNGANGFVRITQNSVVTTYTYTGSPVTITLF
jgi:Glycine rich protein